MLFLSNPLILEREIKWDFEDDRIDFRKKCDKGRFVISGLFLYLLTSLFIIVLNYPLSLTAIAFPIIIFVYTIVVLNDNRRRNLWPIIFMTFSGFILKLITITMFFIFYPLRNDENAPKIADIRKKPGLFGWIRAEEKRLFFGIFFLVEFVLLIIACCLHCYLAAFSQQFPASITTTGGRSKRSSRRSHLV